MENLFVKFFINRNNPSDLDKVTKLVREGWDLLHFDVSTEEMGKDTKIVLSRKI